MSTTLVGSGIALVSHVIRLTHTPKDGAERQREIMSDKQIVVPVEVDLVTGTAPVASVTAGRMVRISHSEYWGPGTWDKIPYTVESHVSVTLQCDQTPLALSQAYATAEDVSAVCTKRGLERGLVELSTEIRTKLYPDLFAGGDDE